MAFRWPWAVSWPVAHSSQASCTTRHRHSTWLNPRGPWPQSFLETVQVPDGAERPPSLHCLHPFHLTQ